MAASDDNEIKVRLQVQAEGFKAQMQSAADSVTAANAQMAESTKVVSASQAAAVKPYMAAIAAQRAQAADLVLLDSIMKKTAKTTTELGVQEAALDRLAKSRAVSSDEYAAALQALNDEEAKMAATTMLHTAALEANSAATVENAVAQSTLTERLRSGNASREYAAFLDEILRHRYSQMASTTAVLSNRLGLLQLAFSPLGLAILGVAAGIVGLIATMVMAENRFNKLQDSLIATGDASGLTAGEMSQMATVIGTSVGTIGGATNALVDLARSGRFAGDEMQAAGQLTADMAQLTGEKVEQAAKMVESLADDPVKAIGKLNEQFHFLTLSEFEQIGALQQAGDSLGATKVAIEDMENTMHARALQSEADANFFVKAFHHMENAADKMGAALNMDLGGGGLQGKLQKLKNELADMQAAGVPEGGATEKLLKTQIASTEAAIKAEQAKAKQTADQDALNQAAIQGKETIDATLKSLKNESEATQQIAKAQAALEAIHKANPKDASLAGMTFHGNVLVGGPAWEKMKAELQAKFSAHTFHASLKIEKIKGLDPETLAKFQNIKIAAPPPQSPVNTEAIADAQIRIYNGAKRVDAAMAETQAQARAEIATINAMFNTVSDAFQITVKGVIKGTETWKEGMRKMGQSMEQEFAAMLVRMTMKWLAMEATKNLASLAGDRTRTASSIQSSDEASMAEVAGAIKTILAKAWQAAAAVYASVSEIPIVGWIAAPALAIAAGMEVAAFVGRVASAAGGWDRVPHDQMAMVHKNEMILPASLAEGARQTFRRGGGNVTHNYNINAMDSRSLSDTLRRNPRAIASAMHHAVRMGAA